MDRSLYAVRDFEDRDFDAMARIFSRNEPRQPVSAEELRRWNDMSTEPPDRVNWKIVVEEKGSGEAVGIAELRHGAWDYHPHKFWSGVSVDPDHQRRGIATELYGRLEPEARTRGAHLLWSGAAADHPGGMRFLERNGFTERRRTWVSSLELATADLSVFPDRTEALERGGVRLTTIAQEGEKLPEVRERLFRLVSIAGRDVPRMSEFTPITFEQFVAFDLEGPGVLPEATFVARVGEEYVGMSSLERDLAKPDTLRVGFTGLRPEYRGRGIASELKRRAVLYARDHGYRFLVTFNDSLNRPIWAINERLGFRQQVVRVNAEKLLAPTRA
jgi:mycothiol synthase